jgi:hypothetical protein
MRTPTSVVPTCSGFPFYSTDFNRGASAATKLFSSIRASAAPRRNCTPWPNAKNSVFAIAVYRMRNFR